MTEITAPGVYDIPADAYHNDPAPQPSLSNSIAKLLIARTPRHAMTQHPKLSPQYRPTEDEKFDIGTAAHSLMLRDPRIFDIIEATDWRTKEAKARRDEARAAGKIPLLARQWVRVQAMVRAGRAQLDHHADAKAAFTNGKPEQTLVWQESGIWCRARLDWLPDSGTIFDDYKSTEASAEADAWQRILFSVGYDMQAAFYRRGIRALGLCADPTFRFVVQEVSEPFALNVIGLMPNALDLADRKVDEAIDRWAWCLKHDRWPGYPNRTCFIDVPSWIEAQQMTREERDHEHVKQHGKKKITETMNDWNAKFHEPLMRTS